MATSIQIVWHTHYNTYKKFYQAFLCEKKEKLDFSQVEFYNLYNLNPYGKSSNQALFLFFEMVVIQLIDC